MTGDSHYAILGLQPNVTPEVIRERIAQKRTHLTKLARVPSRREGARAELSSLDAAERVLLDPSARAAYDDSSSPSRPHDNVAVPVPREAEPSDVDHCASCGEVVSQGTRFCTGCGTQVNNATAHPPRPTEETTAAPAPDDHSRSDSKRPKRFGFFIFLGVAFLMIFGSWFILRRPQQTVVQPKQTAASTWAIQDIPVPHVSLLSAPVLSRAGAAPWDGHNVNGVLSLAFANKSAILNYPDGSRGVFPNNLYSPSGPGRINVNSSYGTVTVNTSGLDSQKHDDNWQVQINSSDLRDINGDGFPELVLEDYSGGAHCCTTLTVVSVRPTGPVIVFDQQLGSGSVAIEDLDGSGKREIITSILFEYSLGSFATGTYQLPVIYSSSADGAYRPNTLGYPTQIAKYYDDALKQLQKASDGDADAEDVALVNLFFLAYLRDNKTEAFSYLMKLRPLESVQPLDSLGTALKAVAPEVLEQPEWQQVRAGTYQASAVAPQETLPQPVPTSNQQTEAASSAEPPVLPEMGVIRDLVYKWAYTYRHGDLSGHLNLYADQLENYFRKADVSRDFVGQDKQRGLRYYPNINRYEVADIHITLSTPTLATAEFVKSWDVSGTGSFRGSANEEMVWRKFESGWKIISEKEPSVIFVDKKQEVTTTGNVSDSRSAVETATPAPSLSSVGSSPASTPVPATPVSETTPNTAIPESGYITWTGVVEADGTVIFEGGQASTGIMKGELPGVPIRIDLDSRNFAIVEPPSPRNSWKRCVIRSKKRQLAIIFKWQKLP